MAKKTYIIAFALLPLPFLLASRLQTSNAVVPHAVSGVAAKTALPTDPLNASPRRENMTVVTMPPVGAADPEVEHMCRRMFDRYGCALVVGVIDANGRHVYAFGKDIHGKQVTGDSQFQIASVSKVFTGLLLAQSVMNHEVRLNQPVADVTSFHVPQFDEEPITFEQLATHLSGLATWPTNRGNTTSPYSTSALVSYLKNAERVGEPGDMTYSNTGYALLGYALACRNKTTYENLLLKRICQPLGMTETRVWPTKTMQSRLAGGHDNQRVPMAPSCPTAGGGADGICSSANDLLKFAGAYAGLVPTGFIDALKYSYATHEPINDDDDIGLGWYIHKPTGIIWKGGNIAGYHSCISFEPQKHLGVVVLSSCNGFPAIPLAESILLNKMKPSPPAIQKTPANAGNS